MKPILTSFFLLGFLNCCSARLNAAVVLDFEEILGQDSNATTGGQSIPLSPTGVYEFGVYRITTSAGNLNYFQYGHPDHLTPASIALHAQEVNSVITLERTDGGTFDLVSMEVGRLDPDSDPNIALNYYANATASGTPNQSFSIDPAGESLVEVSFVGNSAFSDLTTFSWVQQFRFHQFDNITLDVTAVPEPCSLAFVGIGFGIAGIRRCRRRGEIDPSLS